MVDQVQPYPSLSIAWNSHGHPQPCGQEFISGKRLYWQSGKREEDHTELKDKPEQGSHNLRVAQRRSEWLRIGQQPLSIRGLPGTHPLLWEFQREKTIVQVREKWPSLKTQVFGLKGRTPWNILMKFEKASDKILSSREGKTDYLPRKRIRLSPEFIATAQTVRSQWVQRESDFEPFFL